jgi:hypothetical protein
MWNFQVYVRTLGNTNGRKNVQCLVIPEFKKKKKKKASHIGPTELKEFQSQSSSSEAAFPFGL